jgi:CubicO group peptidase (beta-lactamase class C family)
MAKSVTATLAGILARQNRLDVEAAGAIVEWRGLDDPRGSITIDHLLRMTSGLAIREDQSGADPNSRMLFLEADGAAYSARRPLQADPGTHWEYMSGNAVLASRRIPMRRRAFSISASSSCRHSSWWWCAWAPPGEINPTWNGWRLM